MRRYPVIVEQEKPFVKNRMDTGSEGNRMYDIDQEV